MKPCVPPDLQAAAERAARRKDEAIERMAALGASLDDRVGQDPDGEQPDAFETAMQALIDADKRALEAKGR